MSRIAVVAVLASVGVVLVGPLTRDAIAFAHAVQIGDAAALTRFSAQFPTSPHAEQARRLAAERFGVARATGSIDGTARLLPVAFRLAPESLLSERHDRRKLVDYESPSSEGSGDGVSEHFPRLSASPEQLLEIQSTDAVAHLQTALLRFNRETSRCDENSQFALFACLSDALDTFADRVEQTPPTPQGVAPVAVPAIREAARKIRNAKTVQEARAALAEAAEPIRKTIALVKAGGDDIVTRQQVLQRSVVVQALVNTDAILVKAVGI